MNTENKVAGGIPAGAEGIRPATEEIPAMLAKKIIEYIRENETFVIPEEIIDAEEYDALDVFFDALVPMLEEKTTLTVVDLRDDQCMYFAIAPKNIHDDVKQLYDIWRRVSRCRDALDIVDRFIATAVFFKLQDVIEELENALRMHG